MSDHLNFVIEVPNKDKVMAGWDDEACLERLKMLNPEARTTARSANLHFFLP